MSVWTVLLITVVSIWLFIAIGEWLKSKPKEKKPHRPGAVERLAFRIVDSLNKLFRGEARPTVQRSPQRYLPTNNRREAFSMSKSSATYERDFDQIKRSYPTFIADLTTDKLQSKGVLEDWLDKHRRRIATEKLEEWYKFAKRVADLQGVILTIRENETKAEIMELDRQRLPDTRADEVKTAAVKRAAERSDAERKIKENELATRAAQEKHDKEMENQSLELEEKRQAIEKLRLENEALKRKLEQQGVQTKSHGVKSEISSIFQRVQQISELEETKDFLKKRHPERVWKDIEALCERRKGEILKQGRT